MNRCFYCGKGTVMGRSHTHHRGVAGGRWKKRAPKTNRTFKANLQRVTILAPSTSGIRLSSAEVLRAGAAEKVSIKLCTKCIKRIRKDVADGVKPFLQINQLTAKPMPVATA